MKIIAAAFAAAALFGVPTAAAQSVSLTGPNGQILTLSAADIAALPHEHLALRQEGKSLSYEGVPLALLLQKVGAPSGKALRGTELADVVVVTAADGYRVVLALAETDALMRPEHILLADRGAGGAALDPKEGPFRLVVEGDLRAARSARMVTSIVVSQLPAPH
ncbi:MAG TPA: molybdopterin-dependent oxidoreductase [Caulobacteraceae bacterium]